MKMNLKLMLINLLYKVAYFIKPQVASNIMYFQTFRKKQNLDCPRNLIEKINWLQYNTDTSLWTLCADKYRMREYVANRGLGDSLPQIYGCWETIEEIDFSILPKQFVLKSNNSCGTVKIVHDKSELDVTATKKMLKQWLKPYGYVGGQTHYLRIKPCIIAEELLHDSVEPNNAQFRSLIDYKVWCLNGEPECILVIHDRLGPNYLMDMYDLNWERIPNSLKNNAHYGAVGAAFPKPSCLNQMLKMAKNLSEPFAQVRVDFYIINDRPIIGELTFTSGYGNYTESFYNYLGDKLQLGKTVN